MKNFFLFCTCLLLLTVFPGCQVGQSNPTEAPAAAFKAFTAAIARDDYKSAWDLITTDSKERFKEGDQLSYPKFEKMFKEELSKNKEMKDAIASSQVKEVQLMAVVKVEMKKGNETKTEEVQLIFQDGKWKVGMR